MNNSHEHKDTPRTQADVDVAYNEGIREGLTRAAEKALEEAARILMASEGRRHG